MNRLEISLRLKRGLNVVFGDIGTGKTTLCRTLIQKFSNEADFEFHLVFDPGYKTEYQFLYALTKLFRIPEKAHSTTGFKHLIENYLFDTNLNKNRTVVLLIDEGQKLSNESLEILRVFLNYETNEHKLLQLVIFSQLELLPRLRSIPNLLDRVSLHCTLRPLSFEEARSMMLFRLKQAGCSDPSGFLDDKAFSLIYEVSSGLPRKLMYLGRNAIEQAIMNDSDKVTFDLVKLMLNEDSLFNEQRIYA